MQIYVLHPTTKYGRMPTPQSLKGLKFFPVLPTPICPDVVSLKVGDNILSGKDQPKILEETSKSYAALNTNRIAPCATISSGCVVFLKSQMPTRLRGGASFANFSYQSRAEPNSSDGAVYFIRIEMRRRKSFVREVNQNSVINGASSWPR
jgi:hypothetical protein